MPVPKYDDIDPGNPAKRLPILLLLDASGSMTGKPICELNAGIAEFWRQAQSDEQLMLSADVSVVSFGGSVAVVRDFAPFDQSGPPVLSASGNTPMGAAIMTGLDNLETRKGVYRKNGISKNRAIVLLITDGAPTDSWEAAAQRVRQGAAGSKFLFYAVGVTGANMDILAKIAPADCPPLSLAGIGFRELFKRLYDSASQTTRGHEPPGLQVQLSSQA
jgi:uncharacterized protein YegL